MKRCESDSGLREGDGDCTLELGSDAENGRATRLCDTDQTGSWVCSAKVASTEPFASDTFCA